MEAIRRQFLLRTMRHLFRARTSAEVLKLTEQLSANKENPEEIRKLLDNPNTPLLPKSVFKLYKEHLPKNELQRVIVANKRVRQLRWAKSFSQFSFVFGIIILYLLGKRYLFGEFEETNDQPDFLEIADLLTKTPIKEYQASKNDVTFKDVIGCEEAIAELKEVSKMLKFSKKYRELGVTLPKGILLTGPPGTGKTLMARALANECGAKFYYCNGSEFDEMIVGLGSKRIRNLFQTARENAPAVIFIDEIDALGSHRNPSIHGAYRQSINQILNEMDGFRKDDDIIVLAATNIPEKLDSALVRSGRFDKKVDLSLPSLNDRKALLKLFTKRKKLDDSFKIETIAKRTMGMSGADLQNLINLATINAVRQKQEKVGISNFDHAFNQVLMGVRSARGAKDFSDYERRAIAIHEAGHSIVSLLTEGLTKFYKVTILPAGSSLGHTAMTPKQDFLSYTKEQILNQVDIKLGGRAAEEVYLGPAKTTSGCGDDLRRATQDLYSYVRQMGMEEDHFLQSRPKDLISDEINYKIDQRVESILQERYAFVKDLIRSNQPFFDAIVDELVKKETLDAADIQRIQSNFKPVKRA